MIESGLPGFGTLALTALYAGWTDLRDRRLSNGLCLAVAIAGLIQLLMFGGSGALASGAFHAAMALAAGAVLFAVGGLGGGDAKYYAAVACWFDLSHALMLLAAVSLVGMALALGWMVAVRQGRIQGKTAGDTDRTLVPFGIAIALGAVVTAGLA